MDNGGGGYGGVLDGEGWLKVGWGLDLIWDKLGVWCRNMEYEVVNWVLDGSWNMFDGFLIVILVVVLFLFLIG